MSLYLSFIHVKKINPCIGWFNLNKVIREHKMFEPKYSNKCYKDIYYKIKTNI